MAPKKQKEPTTAKAISNLKNALEANAKQTGKHNKILIGLTIALLVLAGVQVYYAITQKQPSLLVATTQESVKFGEDNIHFWVLNNGATDLLLEGAYNLELWCDGKRIKEIGSAVLDPEESQLLEIGRMAFYATPGKVEVHERYFEGAESCYVRVPVRSLITKAFNRMKIPVELEEGDLNA